MTFFPDYSAIIWLLVPDQEYGSGSAKPDGFMFKFLYLEVLPHHHLCQLVECVLSDLSSRL